MALLAASLTNMGPCHGKKTCLPEFDCLAFRMTDALILTALQEELLAVLDSEISGLPWELAFDPMGFPYHCISIMGANGLLRIAAACIGEMGEMATATRASELTTLLRPRCLCMTGICAGRRGDVFLGDVIVADRVYSYDDGKLLASRGRRPELLYQDIETYNLDKSWKVRALYIARDGDWVERLERVRPPSKAVQRSWVLTELLRSEGAEATPLYENPDRPKKCPAWTDILLDLQKARLVRVQQGRLRITNKGRSYIQEERIRLAGANLSDPPFRVHVGPIATGKAVRRDPALFQRLEKSVRKTLGVEMEASAIGYVAERNEILMFIAKAVSDYGDFEKDDSFRVFACRAAATFTIQFLSRCLGPDHEPGKSTHDQSPASGIIDRSGDAGVPGQPYAFTAREDLLRQLEKAVFTDEAPLVCLQGPGGVGKTTLAADFARRYGSKFSRVLWLDVRRNGGATTSILHELLNQLGDPVKHAPSFAAGLSDLWATLGRTPVDSQKALVIFDDADYPDKHFYQLADVLAHSPFIIPIITTRDRRMSDELDFTRIEVRVFSAEESLRCLEQWLKSGDRVKDRPGLEQVSRMLGALPIAIKLGGAYLRRHPTLSLDRYAGQLAELPGEGLERTFEITRQALNSAEEVAFVACSVAGADAFEIRTVAAGANQLIDETRIHLARLFELSVVDRVGTERYVLHPLIRELARKSDLFTQTAVRHADWLFLELGADSSQTLPVQQFASEVASAVDNLDSIHDVERSQKLVARAAPTWQIYGPWRLADSALDRVIRSSRGGDSAVLSNLLWEHARILLQRGEWSRCLSALHEKENVDEKRGAGDGWAAALSLAASLLRQTGDLRGARGMLEKASTLAHKMDIGAAGYATLEADLGSLERDDANFDLALEHYEKALSLWTRLEKPEGRAIVLHRLGKLQLIRHNLDTAVDYFTQALNILQEKNLSSRMPATLTMRGICYTQLGRLPEADTDLSQALTYSKEFGDTRWQAQALMGLSSLRAAQGVLEEAQDLATKSKTIQRTQAIPLLHAV